MYAERTSSWVRKVTAKPWHGKTIIAVFADKDKKVAFFAKKYTEKVARID